MNDLRGSLWRKWDLHIHSPASYHWKGQQLWQMTATEKETAFRAMVAAINDSDIAAFAVMDYWTFDGYLGLRKFLKDHPEVKLERSVFPGIELRCEAPGNFRLNIHALLSDTLSDQQIADFKNALILRLVDRPLSDEALSDFPNKLAADKLKLIGATPETLKTAEGRLRIGQETGLITLESLRNALKALPEDHGFLVLPFDTYGGFEEIEWEKHPVSTTVFMTEADLFEVRRSDLCDLFRGKKTDANARFFDNFIKTIGRPKPAVSGSDAHKFADFGKYPSDKSGHPRITWVKADPTFKGIKQLVNEPAARSFTGEIPHKLIAVRDHRRRPESCGNCRSLWLS